VNHQQSAAGRDLDGEPGLDWLCAGLQAFFAHTEQPVREITGLLKQGRYADGTILKHGGAG
jgi:uncharacterized protein